MGGIDEAALDRLSLVTEMTKHIRVRASGGRTSTSELGQFSPVFVWLLRVSSNDVKQLLQLDVNVLLLATLWLSLIWCIVNNFSYLLMAHAGLLFGFSRG